ncbi:MAG: CsgG/HfaB family protein [Thermoflexibacter sp.]|jgi:hypothetical protein|nr:CsgG/HfaB family protein [Thermoflexibacter sp.]
MKQFISCIIFICLFVSQLSAQDAFDSKLEALAKNIANKITENGKGKVAIWGFTLENGESTPICKFISEDFSVYVTKYAKGFQVIDRSRLDMILKEHKMKSDGLIDETTAKKLGKIIAADAIITGTLTILGETIRVRPKVLDTETALQFAADIENLPRNKNINSYLGTGSDGGSSGTGLDVNQGYNRPLNSNESYNNPETVNPQCKEKNFGDLCFYNTLKYKVEIGIFWTEDGGHYYHQKTIGLYPNETQVFYNITSKQIIKYRIIDPAKNSSIKKGYSICWQCGSPSVLITPDYPDMGVIRYGEINVEQCKSKTYTIK